MEQQCKDDEDAFKLSRMQECRMQQGKTSEVAKLFNLRFELKVASFKDVNGKLLACVANMQKRYKEHFEHLLNDDTRQCFFPQGCPYTAPEKKCKNAYRTRC